MTHSNFRKPTKRELLLLALVIILAALLFYQWQLRHETTSISGSSVSSPGERKPLFYRNPMNAAITSAVPAKDEMGMDYIPVYADEETVAKKTPEQEAEDFFAEEPTELPDLVPITLTPQAIQLAGVITAPAVRERFQISVRTVGMVLVDETRLQHLQTKIDGWVEELHVNFVGQWVKKGDPLLSIYSPELIANQEEYLQALETADRLRKSGDAVIRNSSAIVLKSAQRRLELSDIPEAEIRQLRKTRRPKRSLTLTAPLSGYVIAKDVVAGHKAETGQVLFTIADLSVIWVEADFYEYEAGLLKIGQTALLTSPFDPALELQGIITYIYPYLSVESRTQKVRLEFQNERLLLKPGMYVDVSLQVDAGESVIVPNSAIIDSGVRKVVFIDRGNGLFEPREVRVGVSNRGRTQVRTGLEEGDLVAIKANFLLDSESSLQAIIQQKTAASIKAAEGATP